MARLDVKVNSNDAQPVRLNDMPPSSLGVANNGEIFFRTFYGATCLNNTGATISPLGNPVDIYVKLLKPGESITLTVKEL